MPLRKGGYNTSIYPCPIFSILTFAVGTTVCGCVSPMNLVRRDERGSKPHLHRVLIITIHGMVFSRTSFAPHV